MACFVIFHCTEYISLIFVIIPLNISDYIYNCLKEEVIVINYLNVFFSYVIQVLQFEKLAT